MQTERNNGLWIGLILLVVSGFLLLQKIKTGPSEFLISPVINSTDIFTEEIPSLTGYFRLAA